MHHAAISIKCIPFGVINILCAHARVLLEIAGILCAKPDIRESEGIHCKHSRKRVGTSSGQMVTMTDAPVARLSLWCGWLFGSGVCCRAASCGPAERVWGFIGCMAIEGVILMLAGMR